MFGKPKIISIYECVSECRTRRFYFIPEPFLKQSVSKFFNSGSPYEVMLAIDLFNPDEFYVEYEDFHVEDSLNRNSSDGPVDQKATYVYGCSVISRKQNCVLIEAYGAEESFALNACCAKMICMFWGADEFAQILLQRYESSLTGRKLVIYSKPHSLSLTDPTASVTFNLLGEGSSIDGNEHFGKDSTTDILTVAEKLLHRVDCNKNLKRKRDMPVESKKKRKKSRFILKSCLTVDAFLDQPVEKSILHLVSQFQYTPFKDLKCKVNSPPLSVFRRLTCAKRCEKLPFQLSEEEPFVIKQNLTKHSRTYHVFEQQIVTASGVTIVRAYANKPKMAQQACCAKYLHLIYGPDPIWGKMLESALNETKRKGFLFDRPVEIVASNARNSGSCKKFRSSNSDRVHTIQSLKLDDEEISRGANEQCGKDSTSQLLAGADKRLYKLDCNGNFQKEMNKRESKKKWKKRRFILQSCLTVDAFLEQPVEQGIIHLVSHFRCEPLEQIKFRMTSSPLDIFRRLTCVKNGNNRAVAVQLEQSKEPFIIDKDLTNSQVDFVFETKIVATSGITIVQAYANKPKAARQACCAKYLQLFYGPNPIWAKMLENVLYGYKRNGILFDRPIETVASIAHENGSCKKARSSNSEIHASKSIELVYLSDDDENSRDDNEQCEKDSTSQILAGADKILFRLDCNENLDREMSKSEKDNDEDGDDAPVSFFDNDPLNEKDLNLQNQDILFEKPIKNFASIICEDNRFKGIRSSNDNEMHISKSKEYVSSSEEGEICEDNHFKWIRFSDDDEMHISKSKEYVSSSEEGEIHDDDDAPVRLLRSSSKTVAKETQEKLNVLCCDNDLIGDEDLKLQNAALKAELRHKETFLIKLKFLEETPSFYENYPTVTTYCPRMKIEGD